MDIIEESTLGRINQETALKNINTQAFLGEIYAKQNGEKGFEQ